MFSRSSSNNLLVRALLQACKRHAAVCSLLCLSLLARVALVLRGGQFYYPDEARYWRSFLLLQRLVHLDLKGILELVSMPDHTGFIFIGAPLAAIHTAFIVLSGLPIAERSMHETAWFSGVLFAAPSVISVALVYALSRKFAATKFEAVVAAFLMACSNAQFYYCRHFLPYDFSMALALFALWFGLPSETRSSKSLLCGFLTGLAVLTYNGYWITGGVVIGIHVFYRVRPVGSALKRALTAILAAISLPVGLNVISIVFALPSYLISMRQFSRAQLTQGDVAEGHILPVIYLWGTEHLLLVVWIGASLLALWYCWVDRQDRPFAVWWVAAVVGIYLVLMAGSVGFGRFVVFGRLVRQLIPFLCLSSAYGISQFFRQASRCRVILVIGCAALAIQTGWNMRQPLQLRFPEEVRRTVYAEYGEVNYAVSFNGPKVLGGAPSKPSPYVLINAQFLYPLRSRRDAVLGEVLLSVPHPIQYRPYQYEGLNRKERALLRSGDASIRLVKRLSESPAEQGSGAAGRVIPFPARRAKGVCRITTNGWVLYVHRHCKSSATGLISSSD